MKPLTRELSIKSFAAAAEGSGSSGVIDNDYGRGLKLVIDITAITGTTPTLTVTVRGHDVLSSKTYTLLASAALNTTGTTVLTVFPGATAAANSVASDQLPNTWDVSWTIGGTGVSLTATIGGSILA